jgi:hypothetical protein
VSLTPDNPLGVRSGLGPEPEPPSRRVVPRANAGAGDDPEPEPFDFWRPTIESRAGAPGWADQVATDKGDAT